MSQILSTGFKRFDAEVKNLEGILNKTSPILDVSSYQESLDEIKRGTSVDEDFNKVMPLSGMQVAYEDMLYDKYAKEIENLTTKANEELLPFYKIHALTVKINEQIKDISGDNIGDILNNTRLLIDAINSINSSDKDDKKKLVDDAYRAIYQVLLYEELFDRSDILSYIKYLNLAINKENLGRLLSDDLKKLDRQALLSADLKNMAVEGLGYDYLTEEFIKKVSRVTIGEDNSEYRRKRKETFERLQSKITDLESRKASATSSLKELKKDKFKLYRNKGLLYTKLLSIAMVPIITISAGGLIGKASSDKINEYKTITRTIDLNTNEIVNEPKVVYDEHETTYVATITKYTPWRINPNGAGYIRNATSYEYITPKDVTSDYHITENDINENIREKYSFVEMKDTLEETDSLTDSTILVTETYQDKTDSKKSIKYILPFTIAGTILGIAADIALISFGIYDKYDIQKLIDRLNSRIKDNNMQADEIKDALLDLKNEVLAMQDEYNEAIRKYGSLGEKFIFSDTIKVKKK